MNTQNLTRVSSEQVRKMQLELLSQLDSFCHDNEITYYAFAGTLLGTVRHQGFIPWDNDIDVAVSREDYIRMRALLANEDSHPCFRFLCYENDRNYLWQHGRIVMKHTYMKTARGYEKLGLSIDIFPLDSQGDDYDEARRNLAEIRQCVRLRIMSYDKKYNKTVRYPDCTEQERAELQRLFEYEGMDDEEYWVKRHITLAQRFNDGAQSRYYGCNSNDKYAVVCERRFFSGSTLLPFENTMIPVPSGYEEILRLYYGDYRQLPPKEKQTGVKEMEIYLTE